MNLGRWIRTFTCSVAILSTNAAEPAARPNFLFIYTDDQRWDALGVVQREQGDRGRFPWFETPNLDRLAAEGVRFRNAFVTLALCAPSRAAFLTGRYNHLNGVANNRTPFPLDNLTWATELRRAGYRTGYVGKWHMGGQRGQRPGFDYSASFIGQGRYVDCPFEINGKQTPTEGWVDDISTAYALEFIQAAKDKPWALALGFKTCHGPFTPPDRTKDLFAGAVARPVPNLNVPAIYKAASDPAQPATGQPRRTGPDGTPRTNLGYFRAIRAIDDNIGKLLTALDSRGLAENTVVIFSSDNGFYLGEHMLADKRTAYEESIRIPLLVRFPPLGAKAKLVDELVLNIDLAPTLLDFAGVPPPPQMQGRTLRPLIEGRSPSAWRKAFFYEYFREPRFAPPTVFALRTETAKLIKYPGHEEWTELFDLATDPYQTKNLAGDPAHKQLRAELEAAYEREAAAAAFRIPPGEEQSKEPPQKAP